MEVLVVFLLMIIGVGIFAHLTDSPSAASPKTPEQLDQDAVWFRAQARMLDAQTEYEMKKAEFEDTARFLSSRHKNDKNGGAHV